MLSQHHIAMYSKIIAAVNRRCPAPSAPGFPFLRSRMSTGACRFCNRVTWPRYSTWNQFPIRVRGEGFVSLDWQVKVPDVRRLHHLVQNSFLQWATFCVWFHEVCKTLQRELFTSIVILNNMAGSLLSEDKPPWDIFWNPALYYLTSNS